MRNLSKALVAAGIISAAVAALGLPPDRLERLKTAVGEATMNAMEHGNRYDPEKPVAIQVQTTGDGLIVSITDHGGQAIPEADAPDLEAKLAGLQSPRGWGLFLIRSMVDNVRVTADDGVHHTIELVMKLGNETRKR